MIFAKFNSSDKKEKYQAERKLPSETKKYKAKIH